MIGQIIKVISNDYTVKIGDRKIVCKPRGVFRNKNITPLAGDYCKVDLDNNIITDILDRKNELNRPPVANIDAAVIVVSTISPMFSNKLLDKMINIIEFNNIEPIICISKSDLFISDKINNYISYYKSIGYKVFMNYEIDELKKYLSNKTIILTGQTGVGKSSLLNKIDDKLNLKTDEISKALGRGKHTTRAVEFYEEDSFLIADTPGFSSLNFKNMTKENIRDNFIEFENNRNHCAYSDCMHIKEDNCFIIKMVNDNLILKERYEDYLDFIKEKENEDINFNIKGKK